MTVSQATAEAFLTALRALPDAERQAVSAHIVEDDEWQEDIMTGNDGTDPAAVAKRRAATLQPRRG